MDSREGGAGSPSGCWEMSLRGGSGGQQTLLYAVAQGRGADSSRVEEEEVHRVRWNNETTTILS